MKDKSALKIKSFDEFVKKDLRKELIHRYQSYEIFSEADLQALVGQLLKAFIEQYDTKPERFMVLHKPYLKDLRIHPDLVIFRKGLPWIAIELKETKKANTSSATKDYLRILNVRSKFKSLKRGFLVYLSRYGDTTDLKKPKQGNRFIFPVPVILEEFFPEDEVKKWEQGFKKWAKYVSPKIDK